MEKINDSCGSTGNHSESGTQVSDHQNNNTTPSKLEGKCYQPVMKKSN